MIITQNHQSREITDNVFPHSLQKPVSVATVNNMVLSSEKNSASVEDPVPITDFPIGIWDPSEAEEQTVNLEKKIDLRDTQVMVSNSEARYFLPAYKVRGSHSRSSEEQEISKQGLPAPIHLTQHSSPAHSHCQGGCSINTLSKNRLISPHTPFSTDNYRAFSVARHIRPQRINWIAPSRPIYKNSYCPGFQNMTKATMNIRTASSRPPAVSKALDHRQVINYVQSLNKSWVLSHILYWNPAKRGGIACYPDLYTGFNIKFLFKLPEELKEKTISQLSTQYKKMVAQVHFDDDLTLNNYIYSQKPENFLDASLQTAKHIPIYADKVEFIKP